MSKVFSIAVVLVIAATAVTAAQAQDPATGQRIIVQEQAKGHGQPMSEAPGHSILAQERGRHSDARLFNPSGTSPIVVAGPRDRFDLADAGIGGATALAVTLLVAAGVGFRHTTRRRAVEATSGRS
jgi:hypothetical protein